MSLFVRSSQIAFKKFENVLISCRTIVLCLNGFSNCTNVTYWFVCETFFILRLPFIDACDVVSESVKYH